MDFSIIKDLFSALARERVDYILVGGVAINFHGLARATKDIDLFIRPDPDNIERLKRALQAVFADPDIEQISAADLAGAYPTVRYGPPRGDLGIDILARLGEAFTYDDLEVEEVRIDDIPVRVATPRTLYRMKRDTLRLQDKADAAALQRRFKLEG